MVKKQGTVMRYEYESYLNVTPKANAAKYELIGEAFDELTESLNPEVKENARIHQKNKSSSLNGYAPEYAFTAENFIGDPVAEYVAMVGRDRLTGADAETDIINVCTFIDGAIDGTYRADKQHVAIKVDQVNGGPGVESMPLTGSFLYKGDPIKGSWNPETKEFTPDTQIVDTNTVE